MPENGGFESGRDEYVGKAVSLFDYIAYGSWVGEVELTGFSVRIPESRLADVLVVLRGMDVNGAPLVAFHSEPMVAAALAGAARRMRAGRLKWREDEYRK